MRELSGDPEAFGRIYDAYQARVYAYIALRVGSREDAETLTSKAFERALQNIESRPPDTFFLDTWLVKMAREEVSSNNHKIPGGNGLNPVALREIYGIDLDSHPDGCRLEIIMGVLGNLDEEDREILTLKIIEGFSNQELAEILDCGQEELSEKVLRALQELERCFNDTLGMNRE